MEFESPDVEKDFPGLYESGKRSQESDFSDDAHDKPSKKDLLIGKRKDKKESKKDQGYAALEGESSPEEDLDMKSPSKSKKSKSFKFPTIKEKREKSREKDVRDKEREAEKEKDKKKDKGKLKLKERKKSKHGDDESDIGDALPVFGVPLAVAVERSHCHDGVALPLVIRNCIDHVQDCGLLVEGVYKMSGIKSKIQQLKRSYNQREAVTLSDYDLATASSLLKAFLSELPEPIVTAELLPRFEEVASIKEMTIREQELAALISMLPRANLEAVSWLFLHFEAVAAHEKQNKMGSSALAATLAPTLQMSQRLFVTLLTHSRAFFPNVRLKRYVPPMSAGSSSLPDTAADITGELQKQESLLSQIHSEMNLGYTSTQRTEQLWEVQRLVTQLKRKLKSLERAQESSHTTVEDTCAAPHVPATTENAIAAQSSTVTVTSSEDTTNASSGGTTNASSGGTTNASSGGTTNASSGSMTNASSGSTTNASSGGTTNASSGGTTNASSGSMTNASSGGSNGSEAEETLVQDDMDVSGEDAHHSGSSSGSATLPVDPAKVTNDMARIAEFVAMADENVAELMHQELERLQANLLERIRRERATVEKLRAELIEFSRHQRKNSKHGDLDNDADSLEELETELKQNVLLQQNKRALLQKIMEERDACLQLRVKCSTVQKPERKLDSNQVKVTYKPKSNSMVHTPT